MEALFHDLLAWVGHNPGWAYGVVFLVGMTESLAVIGVVIPGVIILIGAGALVAAGAIGFWPTFLAAVAGAIVGDGLSYSLGRHFDQRIRTTWPFSRYPEQLAQGEAFFQRYGALSVALGRFFGPIRAIVPVVAGMMRLPAPQFYVANVTSAFAQIFSYLLPGMLFGASLKLAAEAAMRLAILGLGLIASLWLAGWAIHRVYVVLSPHAGAMVSGLLRWADLHPHMGRVAQALADPDHPAARTLTWLAFLLVVGGFLAGVVAGGALLGPAELALNQAALDFGQSLHTPPADRLMALAARLGEPWALLPMVLGVFLFLRRDAGPDAARYWLAAGAFALIAAPLLGALLRVPRPDLGLDLILPWSFPSASVLLATCLFGFLAVITARGLPERFHWVPYAMAAGLVVGIVWARLYFGAEWLTDLIGSVGLGLVWIATLGLAFRRHSRADPHYGALLAVSAVTFAAGFVGFGWISGERELARFQPRPHLQTLAAEHWRSEGWRGLPRYREDLGRSGRHLLTFQYAGDPADLETNVEPLGWAHAEPLGWGNLLRLLSPSLPLKEMPVIRQVHDGHHEVLLMTRDPSPDRREVLRLWPTSYRLGDGRPIWVGNLTVQEKEIVINLLAFPVTTAVEIPASETLYAQVSPSLPARATLMVTATDPGLTR
jgi:membrane protein DedA with SNARE-associated domain